MTIKLPHPRHATVVAYLALFVATSGATYAATGGTFILGRANAESTTTTLTNTGTAAVLSLHAQKGRPALAVNNTTKISHLNADLLDGSRAGVVHPYTASVSNYAFNASTVPLGQAATIITKVLPKGTYFFDVTGRVAIYAAEDDTHCDLWLGSTWSGLGNAVEVVPASGEVTQQVMAFAGVATVPANTPAVIKCDWADPQSAQAPSVNIENLHVTAIPVSSVN